MAISLEHIDHAHVCCLSDSDKHHIHTELFEILRVCHANGLLFLRRCRIGSGQRENLIEDICKLTINISFKLTMNISFKTFLPRTLEPLGLELLDLSEIRFLRIV